MYLTDFLSWKYFKKSTIKLQSVMVGQVVKENVVPGGVADARWLAAALCGTALALAAVARIDSALPAPRAAADTPPDHFCAELAHQHLVNLTSIGPRVAGSYENEVAAVGALVAAVRRVAAGAAPHNRVELDVHVSSGAFSLTFLDGMSNVYRDVQSVVARVSAAGAPPPAPAPRRDAVLINSHFDTVPDSPGASDDGAGCAVALETLRALAASAHPLRRPVVVLLNGAEENIMQASHGFITQHPWARRVRAFVNIEACGAGGREVLFQAGPRDPFLIETYATRAPHPFASSLAQELFESGLVPGDTDFRVFRDFGNLSGVDLAWSANGYVYHTRLDTAAGVPPAALQRTGDNVLALVRGLLENEDMDTETDPESRQPVFFDVLGAGVVWARAPAASVAALATALLVLLRVHLSARAARRHLYVREAAWWGAAGRAALALGAGAAAGLAGAGAAGGALGAAGARLSFYSRGWLLAPLYALPALCCGALGARGAWARLRPPLVRGWWEARAAADAAALCWAGALGACAVRGVRSGFLPLLCALLPSLADAGASLARAPPPVRAACWAAGAALPVAHMWYLALGTLHMFVPVMGRAGTTPLPPDVLMALLVAALVLATCSWMVPLLLVTRNPNKLIALGLAVCGATCALVWGTRLGAPYSAERPQRFMVFHTRRTVHAGTGTDRVEHLYWLPELDANTPHSVDKYVPELAASVPTGAGGAECARWVYCGAPYYLPVLGMVARGHAAPAPAAPLARAHVAAALAPLNATTHVLHLNVTGPNHIVVIISPVEGARVSWCSALGAAPIRARPWGRRDTHFLLLHDARRPRLWQIEFHLQHAFPSPRAPAPARWADLSVAGHALLGPRRLHAAHARLLASFPPWAAPTGWGVDLHLLAL